MSTEEKFDKRTIERRIKSGEISEKEHQKYLAGLEDWSHKAVPVETKFVYNSDKQKSAK
jgi:hypothetical protein